MGSSGGKNWMVEEEQMVGKMRTRRRGRAEEEEVEDQKYRKREAGVKSKHMINMKVKRRKANQENM